MKKSYQKRKWLILVFTVFGLLYATTYIPQRVITTTPSSVARIHIFDGQSGYELDLSDRDDINAVMQNLNDVTFQKGKVSFGYMGYSYHITLYGKDGDELDDFIINSADTVRYRGFFYTAKSGRIDYDMLDEWMQELKSYRED